MPRVAVFALLLAGCVEPASFPTANEPGRACHDDRLASFIGNAATEQVGAVMLRASGARSIRWVSFGAIITMEFSPTRLTVQLDQQNRVNSARCG